MKLWMVTLLCLGCISCAGTRERLEGKKMERSLAHATPATGQIVINIMNP